MREEGGSGGCGEDNLVGVVNGERIGGGAGSGDTDERTGGVVDVALQDSGALGGGVFSAVKMEGSRISI